MTKLVKKSPKAATRSKTLEQEGNLIARISWSPSGKYLAAGARTGIATVWDAKTGATVLSYSTGTYHVYSVCWSPDEQLIAISCDDSVIRILEVATAVLKRNLTAPGRPSKRTRGRTANTMGLAWSLDGAVLASGSDDGLRLWNISDGAVINSSDKQTQITGLSWSPNGSFLASTSYAGTIFIWKADSLTPLHRISTGGYTSALSWAPDSTKLAISRGAAIEIRDALSGNSLNVLEAHSTQVRALSYSSDGQFLASRASAQDSDDDQRVFIWKTDEWRIAEVLTSPSSIYLFSGLAFSPRELILAESSQGERGVSLWKFDYELLKNQSAKTSVVYYKNAKIALVGNSGVGKSGLALVLGRLAFEPTASSHGRRITNFESSEHSRSAYRSEIREAVLWDLAGQPGYRLIHQLHLDDVDVGVVVFDSKDEIDPMAGVDHWNRALNYVCREAFESKPKSLPKVLVAARVDRGAIGVSRKRIQEMLGTLNISKYVETSAKEDIGIKELRQILCDLIPWDDLPTISSNQFLQEVRSFLAEEAGQGRSLASLDDLFRAFARRGPKEGFDLSKFKNFSVCLNRLQRLGVVRRFTFGNLILLRPELLDSYAAAIIFAAKNEPDGMGSIPIQELLSAGVRVPEEDRLIVKDQEQLLLFATIEDMLSHEIALRESSSKGELLVFPSELTRENPEMPDPKGKEVKVDFIGPVRNIYASLIIRLAYSDLYQIQEMWKNAVVFATVKKATCGLYLSERGDGAGSITIFFGSASSAQIKSQFEHYVISHLNRRAALGSIRQERYIACSACGTPVTDIAVTSRRARGFSTMSCNVCDQTISLEITHFEVPDPESTPETFQIDRRADEGRTKEAALVSASGELLSDSFRQWAGGEKSTLAIVFTDLVGSTALANEVGDELMFDLRHLHFRAARELIKTFGGYEIKTLGDSFMVAFRTVIDALDFAQNIMKAPGTEGWKVRAGIHVGPVRIDERDAFGSMVNYSARLVGSIPGAELRLSDRAYQDLVLERPKRYAAVVWREIKNLPFKGFLGRQRAWEASNLLNLPRQ